MPKNQKIICVVKGNAYGHGLKEVASILNPLAEYFGVNSFEELVELRKVSKKPVLVMGYVEVNEVNKVNLKILKNTEFVAYSINWLKVVDKLSKKLNIKTKVWIKVDANLGRQGIFVEQLKTFLESARALNSIDVIGVYGHFANVEDTINTVRSEKQISIIKKAKEIMVAGGYKDAKFHISATGGAMLYPKVGDFTRVGIGLYGLWPAEHLQKTFQKTIQLKPVLSWKTHLVQVKEIPKGFSVGYGLSFVSKKAMKIGIVPQGYADGYDRKLSNKGEVLVSGKRCKVIGRVAMNMFAVDLSRVPNAKEGDEVVLIGSQGKQQITAEQIANKIETINYEVVTRISSLLRRKSV